MKKLCPAQRFLNNAVTIVVYLLVLLFSMQLDNDYITCEQFISNIGKLVLWVVAVWSSLTLTFIVLGDKIKKEEMKRRVGK